MLNKINQAFVGFFSVFQDLALLSARLVLAAGFFGPAIKKITHFQSIVTWFDSGLHLPFPLVNAVLATSAEALGVVLLTLGFKTRLISLPLMVTMLVAIFVVHGTADFSKIEIPLAYFAMLFVLLSHGPGKYSIDNSGSK